MFFFCEISSQALFLVKNEKNIFFFNFIKILKNVARRIFNKRLCYFYISSFFLRKIHLLDFFTPFSCVSVKYPHSRHFWSKMRKKKSFVLIYQIIKKVARWIFDKRLCYFYILTFFWDKTHFLDFFGSFLLFSDFLLFFVRFILRVCRNSAPQNFENEQSKRFSFAESNILCPI